MGHLDFDPLDRFVEMGYGIGRGAGQSGSVSVTVPWYLKDVSEDVPANAGRESSRCAEATAVGPMVISSSDSIVNAGRAERLDEGHAYVNDAKRREPHE